MKFQYNMFDNSHYTIGHLELNIVGKVDLISEYKPSEIITTLFLPKSQWQYLKRLYATDTYKGMIYLMKKVNQPYMHLIDMMPQLR